MASPRPPPSFARRSEGARPSELSTGPRDAGRRPESEDGLGFSIGADPSDRRLIQNRGHPAPPIGEFADRGKWPTTEGAELRREVPSKGLLLRLFVWGRHPPGGGDSLIGGTASPAPPSAGGADWNGNWRRELEETHPPSPFPPFSIVVCSSSAFPPMSCLQIRVGGPGFSKRRPPPPRAPPRGLGVFPPSDRSKWRRGLPSAPLFHPPPIVVGTIGLSPDSKIGGGRIPAVPHRRRGRWGADSEDLPLERSTLRVWKCPPPPRDQSPRHRRSGRCRWFGGGVSNPTPPTLLDRPGWRLLLPSWSSAVHNFPPGLPPPSPPLRGVGWGEIVPCLAFRVPPVRGIRKTRGGSPRHGAGADPAVSIEGRASPHSLQISSSPTRVSGVRFAHRGGQAPPRTPTSHPLTIPHLTPLLMLRLRCPSTSKRHSSLAPSSHALRPRSLASRLLAAPPPPPSRFWRSSWCPLASWALSGPVNYAV